MTYEITVTEQPEQWVAVVRGHATVSEIADLLGQAFGEVAAALGAQGLAPSGPPFGRYVMAGDGFDVAAGFPVPRPVTPTGRVEGDVLPGGAVAMTTHVGSYETVSAAWEAVMAWLGDHGMVVCAHPWESYLDGPEVALPRTVVCVPCRPR